MLPLFLSTLPPDSFEHISWFQPCFKIPGSFDHYCSATICANIVRKKGTQKPFPAEERVGRVQLEQQLSNLHPHTGQCGWHAQYPSLTIQPSGYCGTSGRGWITEMGEHGRPKIQICIEPSFISLASYSEKAITVSKAFTAYGGSST